MQEIAHHALGDPAIGLDEQIAEVEKAYPVAVVEFVEGLVDLEGLGALVAEILAEGENAQEQDFGSGQLLAELVDDGGDAFEDVAGVVVGVGDVVDADKDDRNFVRAVRIAP